MIVRILNYIRSSYPTIMLTTITLLSSSITALRQASNKLPVLTEFISKSSPPRLGNLIITPEESETEVEKEDLGTDNSAPTHVPPISAA